MGVSPVLAVSVDMADCEESEGVSEELVSHVGLREVS